MSPSSGGALVLALALTLIALIALVACTPAAPKRPFGVPASAAWADGSWVDCWRDENDERAFACSIYTKDAKIDAKGAFTLVDVDGAPTTRPREPMKYTAWDGRSLHLEGGRMLVKGTR